MVKCWIAVASREHVIRGVQGGFMQVCHGKPGPLKRAKEGDWVVYYSPVDEFGTKNICRKFTALGKIEQGDPYQYEMSADFIPWRRKVHFFKVSEVAIVEIRDKIGFIKNNKNWGILFRRGFFEIAYSDFKTIATSMGVSIEE